MSEVANRRRIGTRWLLAFIAGMAMVSGLALMAPGAVAQTNTVQRFETGLPPSVGVSQPVTFNVTATDATGGKITSYTGRVRFSSSDPLAGLPSDYTFSAADQGTKAFTVTFGTQGKQNVRVFDANNNTLFGQAETTVGQNAVCDPRFTNSPYCNPGYYCDPRYFNSQYCSGQTCNSSYYYNSQYCGTSPYCDPRYSGTNYCSGNSCDPSYYGSSYCYGSGYGQPCTMQYPNNDPRCNAYTQPYSPAYYPPGHSPYGTSPYGYGYGTVSAAPAALNPGDSTVVSGSGFAPRDSLDIGLNNGQSLGTTVVDPGGNFRQTVTVPATTPGGSYTLVVTSRGRGQQATTPVTVGTTTAAPLGTSTAGYAQPAQAGTTSRIPFTGARENRMVAIALAFIFGGLLLMSSRSVLARRRA